MRTPLRLAGLASLFVASVFAEPLSRPLPIDFYREVPSRNLQGLATRSDGALVAGPQLRSLTGDTLAELLWCIRPGLKEGEWVAGSGPDGRLVGITLDAAAKSFAASEIVKLPDSQVLSLAVLANGDVLAGTSPRGLLALVRGGHVMSQVCLPADSILDILVLGPGKALVSTGNPGRVYSVDLERFASAGIVAAKPAAGADLSSSGLVLFGEVRDRNLRKLARLPDGRIVAGSSPRGNIYLFPETGGAPQFLMENHDAEVTDLLVQADGTLYASLVSSAQAGELRISRPQPGQTTVPPVLAAPGANPNGGGGQGGQTQQAQQEHPSAQDLLPLSLQDKFSGRSQVVCIPLGGFPEVVSVRAGLSIYRLAQQGTWLLMAGGEQGDLLGYDTVSRMALTFSGSQSSQLNDLVPMPGTPGRFLVLRNNLPGLSVLDFNDESERSAETRRIELPAPALLGGLRIPLVSGLEPKALRFELRTSSGSEDGEGWTAWQTLAGLETEGAANFGWQPPAGVRGRHVRLKVSMPAGIHKGALVDKAVLYQAPQNRRPLLSEFRSLSQGFEIIPASEPPQQLVASLGQIINQAGAGSEGQAERRKSSFLSSQVVPSPGTQEFFWSLVDPDGDNLVVNFSLRKAGASEWNEVAVASRESHVRIDAARLEEGLYNTRLIVSEDAPRPSAERLSSTFYTEDFVVDRTPPVISEASAKVLGSRLVVTVSGADALSLLEGVVLSFNNGLELTSEQPADGIRDQRKETFVVELPLSQASGATQIEASLYDDAGNRKTTMIKLGSLIQ